MTKAACAPPAALLGGATWQRCQFHLARNAIRHAPKAGSRKRIGRQLKAIWTADDLAKAETALAALFEIDEKWASDTKACLKWEWQDA